MSRSAQTLYLKKIKHKKITEFRVFDYQLLKGVGMDLFDVFIWTGIYKFCGFFCDYYLEMIREFYANMYIGEDSMLKSYVNVVDIQVLESLLAHFFHLSNKGKPIVGEISKETPKGPIIEANVEAIVQ